MSSTTNTLTVSADAGRLNRRQARRVSIALAGLRLMARFTGVQS